jgi:hypothetical protein
MENIVNKTSIKKELTQRLSVVDKLGMIRVTVTDDDWEGYNVKLYIPLGGNRRDDRTFKAWHKELYISIDHAYLMKGTDSYNEVCTYIISII